MRTPVAEHQKTTQRKKKAQQEQCENATVDTTRGLNGRAHKIVQVPLFPKPFTPIKRLIIHVIIAI